MKKSKAKKPARPHKQTAEELSAAMDAWIELEPTATWEPPLLEDAARVEEIIAPEPKMLRPATLPAAPAPRTEQATLRDQFAMAALQGLLANLEEEVSPKAAARLAYECADAMLERRGQ